MALMRKRSVRPRLKGYSGKWASVGASDLISQLIAPGGSLQVCVCVSCIEKERVRPDGVIYTVLPHCSKTLVN